MGAIRNRQRWVWWLNFAFRARLRAKKCGVVIITEISETIIEFCLVTTNSYPFHDFEGCPLTLLEAQKIFNAIPAERSPLRLKFLVFLSQKNEHFAEQKANVQWMAAKIQKIKKERKIHRETSFSLMLLSVERSLGEELPS